MIEGQKTPALISALIKEGVNAEIIEKAVARVLDVQLGQSISFGQGPTVRAFAFEQSRRLEKKF